MEDWYVVGPRKDAAETNLDHASSVYVGDAAGRKRDHSNTDYTMALNAGMKFVTPEVG
jgi:bifunctional polynucleotide phosphatase/kinase